MKDSPCLLQAEEDEGEGDEADEGMLDDEAAGVGEPSVRWAPRKYGLPSHTMALITSGRVTICPRTCMASPTCGLPPT